MGRQDEDEWEGWHLKEVQLKDKDTGQEQVFEFNRWMDREMEDHDIVREIPAKNEGKQPLPSEYSLVRMPQLSVISNTLQSINVMYVKPEDFNYFDIFSFSFYF